jgi:maltose O-acetyltransferase
MLAGEPYDASDPGLVAARIRARRLTQRFNALDPGDLDAHRVLLSDLLGDAGTGSWVEAPLYCD